MIITIIMIIINNLSLKRLTESNGRDFPEGLSGMYTGSRGP